MNRRSPMSSWNADSSDSTRCRGCKSFADSKGRKILHEPIQVDHRGEADIGGLFLPLKALDIVLHGLVTNRPSPMDITFSTSMSDHNCAVQVHSEMSEMRTQDSIRKRTFGLALHEQINAGHQCGPPPITFFSQISPKLYSSSHASSFSAPGR